MSTKLKVNPLADKFPIGYGEAGMNDREVVMALFKRGYMKDDFSLTTKGEQFVEARLKEMTSSERILLERFVLEFHGVEVNIIYPDNE